MTTAQAQQPDPDVQAAQKQQQIAAAQAAAAQSRAQMAQAEVARVRAELPTDSTVKPQAGSIDDSAQSGILARAVALSALDHAAHRLVEEIFEPGAGAGQRFLLVDGAALTAADLVHQQAISTLAGLAHRLDELTDAVTAATEPPGAGAPPISSLPTGVLGFAPGGPFTALTGARSALGAIADIVGYFSGLVTVRGVDLTVTSSAAISAVAKALQHHGVKAEVVITGLSLVDPDGPLMKTLAKVATARAKFAQAISRYDLAQSARTDAGGAADTVTRLTSELAAADAVVAAITSAPKDGGPPILAQAATAEVAHLPGRGIDRILSVNVDAAGGETVTVSSILRRTRISYIGACRLSATLTNPNNGTVMGAGSGFAGAQVDYRPSKDESNATTWRGFASGS